MTSHSGRHDYWDKYLPVKRRGGHEINPFTFSDRSSAKDHLAVCLSASVRMSTPAEPYATPGVKVITVPPTLSISLLLCLRSVPFGSVRFGSVPFNLLRYVTVRSIHMLTPLAVGTDHNRVPFACSRDHHSSLLFTLLFHLFVPISLLFHLFLLLSILFLLHLHLHLQLHLLFSPHLVLFTILSHHFPFSPFFHFYPPPP
ncbi:unnamed protein product, partial [Protopolystoma xenopodis]